MALASESRDGFFEKPLRFAPVIHQSKGSSCSPRGRQPGSHRGRKKIRNKMSSWLKFSNSNLQTAASEQELEVYHLSERQLISIFCNNKLEGVGLLWVSANHILFRQSQVLKKGLTCQTKINTCHYYDYIKATVLSVTISLIIGTIIIKWIHMFTILLWIVKWFSNDSVSNFF